MDRCIGIAKVEKDLPGKPSLIAELDIFIRRGEFSQAAISALYPWLINISHTVTPNLQRK